MNPKAIAPSVIFVVAALLAIVPGQADTSTPVNYIGVSFAPFTIGSAVNYDWSTGDMTPSTATTTVSSSNNTFQAVAADPSPPDPNGFGTFIGTARPTRFDDDTVLYTQSACPTGFPTCLADGSFTAGYMVLYNLRGATLDQLTNLAATFYVQQGDCGGGSPRFSIGLSNGAEVHVYFGPFPDYTGCTPDTWMSTGNFVTNPELRWDSSQIGGTFYGSYQEAVTLADTEGLTISEIFVATDTGWFGTNPATGQVVLYKDIEVNEVTRFP